jgi:signal peptidase I
MTERTKQGTDAYALLPETAVDTKSKAPVAMPVGGEAQPSMTWMLLRELVETVVLSLVIFLLIRQVVQNYRIESHSMEPNFYEGQFILVNKLAFKLGAPERGDVIVFHNPNNTDEDYIKRVIGLPGDSVEIHDQTVFINGEAMEELFPHNEILRGTQFGPVLIEPDHLFVMGDNRPQSKDSREFGPLSEELLVGKAWVRVWPFNLFGVIRHYDLEPGVVSTGG